MCDIRKKLDGFHRRLFGQNRRKHLVSPQRRDITTSCGKPVGVELESEIRGVASQTAIAPIMGYSYFKTECPNY